jgi:hypothetical protein
MKIENGVINLGYYDNANSDLSIGKSSDNQLNVNTTTGAMTDTTNLPVRNVTSYEVTEVRETKKKKE